jgi:hypothetical protein
MAYRLKLKRFELTNVNFRYVGAFRMRIEASDPDNTGVDPNVFLYQRNLPNPYDGSVTDIYLGISSIVDMSDYPIGEPVASTTFPFYRLDYVELDVRAVQLADQIWGATKTAISRLLRIMDTMKNNLSLVEEVWICESTEEGQDSEQSAVYSASAPF